MWYLLKAVYFHNCGMMDAPLGHRPSFTCRNLWGVRWVIEGGSQWKVGDGYSLNIWDARWIPRPSSFKVITPFNPRFFLLRVGDLIDKERGSWNVNMLNEVSLPVDVVSIVKIPLSWVFCHGSANGQLTVNPAYHFIKQRSGLANPSSSSDMSKKRWRQLWALTVPPRIKLFA